MRIRPQPPLSIPEYKTILRHDLASFIEAGFRELNPHVPYFHGRHIEVMASHLEACMRGEIRRLIINLPPRSLKSHCVSVAFPAYLLGHMPGKRIICVSYAQDLSEKLGRETRKLMTSPLYRALFRTRLGGKQAASEFETTAGGSRLSTSLGGVITGLGGEFLILDDPQKPDEILSEGQRKKDIEWFRNTLLSRQNDKATACIIIVMQRLHEDDLCGQLIADGGWKVLSFPAIAEEDRSLDINNVLGRRTVTWKEGEALHPEREPLEVLAEIRRGMQEANFSSQYQQRPMPLEGNILKKSWLHYYEPGSQPARFDMIVQSWDTANKTGEMNDFSVCTTWGIHRHKFYLLHVFRARLDFPNLQRKACMLAKEWRAHKVLIEDKASGTQLIQDLKERGVRAIPYKPAPGYDKEMRLHAQTAAFESGQVFLPSAAPWLADYVAELTGFPGAKFDDQVDSTTQFLDHVRSKRSVIITDEMLAYARSRARPPLVAF
ncbi:MAG: phage terminase large subunit [Alphaproteobacteria bacterium]|nr:phage terminase large subunit [Alphaproteobacteria bacterium]